METFSRYFPISKEDEDWGIYILGCGTSSINKGSDFPLRSHPSHHYFRWNRGRILPEFQIFYLLKGEGIFESKESGRLCVKPGAVVFLFPGVWHRYKPLAEGVWHTFWVSFNGPLAKHLVEKLHFSASEPVYSLGYHQTLIQAFIEIIETSRTEFTGYQQILAGEVCKVLGWLHALRRREEFTDVDIDTLMQQAKLIIMNSPLEISMEEVAAKLNMGYSKFRKVFRQYTGMAPKQYQMQLRIKKAILLLYDESRSIKEVAIESGFMSPYYFSRIFKRKTGYSPKAYRQKFGKK